jgi:hypothetical protein
MKYRKNLLSLLTLAYWLPVLQARHQVVRLGQVGEVCRSELGERMLLTDIMKIVLRGLRRATDELVGNTHHSRDRSGQQRHPGIRRRVDGA